MRRILLFCFLLAFGYMPALGRATPRFPKRFTRDEKIETLSRVWAEVKYNFAYIDRVDFDIDSLYRATLPRVIASKNDVEFMDELRRFMVCFNDGHTNVGYPSYNWSRFHDFAPARFEEIGGRYYLGYLTEDSGLDSLALGAELVEIEGEPTREYVRRNYYPLITGGSERMKANMATTNYIGAGVGGGRVSAAGRPPPPGGGGGPPAASAACCACVTGARNASQCAARCCDAAARERRCGRGAGRISAGDVTQRLPATCSPADELPGSTFGDSTRRTSPSWSGCLTACASEPKGWSSTCATARAARRSWVTYCFGG